MKLLLKIFIFITFPIWILPFIIVMFIKILWEDISEFVDNSNYTCGRRIDYWKIHDKGRIKRW